MGKNLQSDLSIWIRHFAHLDNKELYQFMDDITKENLTVLQMLNYYRLNTYYI